MLVKEIKKEKEAREELLKGINIAADMIGATMGYLGRNIIYETQGGKPKSTKDGVTVAREVFLEEPLHSLGAELLKEACNKTVDECGDSTTNTAVLSQAIIQLANKAVNEGHHPIQVKRGVEDATKEVLRILKLSKKRVTKKDYFHVANISANSDKELGKIISDAFIKSGKNGKVLHDKSPNDKTYIELTEGLPIERGWANRFMINNTNKEILELENPYLFVCDKTIDSIQEIKFLYEFIGRANQKSVVIIGELDNKTEQLVNANRARNNFNLFYIKAPSFGSKRTDLLQDIAIATGATFLHKSMGDSYESMGSGVLGQCKSLKATKNETVIQIDNINQEAINAQVKNLSEISSRLNNNNQKMQKDFIEERIAKLSCSVAKIMVGANSEVELYEKIDRVDDAVNALKSAIEEGIVLGGGVALLRIAEKAVTLNMDESYAKGFYLLTEAIKAPFKKILFNGGYAQESENIAKQIIKNNDNSGFDVSTGEIVDMYKEGIIDPHKAIRCALQNASSIASTFLLTEGTINIKREEKQ